MARGLNGTSQYLSRADSTELRVAFPLAVGFWFKGAAQGNFKYLLSKLLLAGDHPSYGFATDGAGALRFLIGWGTSVNEFVQSPTVAAGTVFDNNWHYFLGTYDGSFVRLFYDNNQAGSGTAETRAVGYSTDSLYVGSFDGTQLYAAGSVAELTLFNAVPNTEERTALAAGWSPLAVKPAAVVGYWPLIGRYSPEIDVRQGLNLTVTSATAADHCRVFQRAQSLWVALPGDGLPPPAWTYAYDVLIG